MVKPTNAARWAEALDGTPSADIVEPNGAQKDAGWAANQAPPASYFNWWQWAVYQWIKWLRDSALVLLDAAQTFTAKQTFQAGLATPLAPAAGDDVANKAYVDGGDSAATAFAASLRRIFAWATLGTSDVNAGACSVYDGDGITATNTETAISVTFSTPMPDTDYAVLVQCENAWFVQRVTNKTVNGFTIGAGPRWDGSTWVAPVLTVGYAFSIAVVRNPIA
ncbi:hypothetical protein [Anaeromyxobacter soli]|uniref:hypothetical protein n=1 Tax=Anaeromyxobacter soli TaxID=2922725 RepID=UPI001FB00011|nr:hypothetical protein [Anaeromyxobacter sp. SG29]